jgi:hypothetical protein
VADEPRRGYDVMALMVGELYDALVAAGAPEDKARHAAEAVANYEKELADIRGDLRVLKWSTSATLALVIGIFVKLFIHG